MEAIRGGAGAIADTMNAYSEALASVPVSKTGYNAMRDCVILYTSPGYGDWSENTEQWNHVQTLWCNVVRQLKHPENFAVTVREQFRNDNNAKLRIKELSDRIHQIAPACGLHVFIAAGADLYYNNAPFSCAPEIFSSCEGARAVFAFNGILFQRPQLMFNSECLWNMTVRKDSLVKQMPKTREECNQKLSSCIRDPLPQEYHDNAGWLAKACRFLYGEKAGGAIFRYQLLRSPSGCFPLSILYFETRMQRKLFQIMDDPDTDREAEVRHWRETVEISHQGLKLIQKALRAPASKMSAALSRELKQQKKTLKTGIILSEAVLAYFSDDAAGYVRSVKQFSKAVRQFPHDFIAPEEGDASFYSEYAAGLERRIQNLSASGR